MADRVRTTPSSIPAAIRRRTTFISTTPASPTKAWGCAVRAPTSFRSRASGSRGQQVELEFSELTADQIRFNDFVNRPGTTWAYGASPPTRVLLWITRRLLEYWTDEGCEPTARHSSFIVRKRCADNGL